MRIFDPEPQPEPFYWDARRDHAAWLRVRGLTYCVIGDRLGVTATQGRNLVLKHARLERWSRVDKTLNYCDVRHG